LALLFTLLHPSTSTLFPYTDALPISIANEARKTFGEAIFANSIYHRERVKRWANEGLTHKQNDVHDSRTHEMYTLFFKELLYRIDRKSTRLNSSHVSISYAVFCLKKK